MNWRFARIFALTLGLVPGVMRPAAALEGELIRFWRSCYVVGGLNACASFTMYTDPFGEHPNSFIGILDAPDAYPIGAGPFRVTGMGLLRPGANVFMDLSKSEDGWGLTPTGWESDFILAIGTEHWDAALGGTAYGSEGFWGWWEGELFPAGVRFAWRGVTQDQSFTFDCIQNTPTDELCASTASPEPSTWILLLTGLIGVALAAGRRRIRIGA